MDMKKLMLLLGGGAALLTACLNKNQKEQLLPGTYVSSTNTRGMMVFDTIMIWHQAGQLYQVLHMQSRRRQKGKLQIDRVDKRETGVAVYLPEDQILLEKEHGWVFTLNLDRGLLLVNCQTFKRSVL